MDEDVYVGIDVSKTELVVAVRPSGKSFTLQTESTRPAVVRFRRSPPGASSILYSYRAEPRNPDLNATVRIETSGSQAECGDQVSRIIEEEGTRWFARPAVHLEGLTGMT
jgi:hypothetical protein